MQLVRMAMCGRAGKITVYSSHQDGGWSAAAGALTCHHDLLITDEHGPGLREFLRHAPVTVWIEGAARDPVRRVLAAMDPFAPPEITSAVLDDARVLAGATLAELFALCAWSAPGEDLLARYDSVSRTRSYVAAERERARAAFDACLRHLDPPLDEAHRLCERGRPAAVIVRAVCERQIDAVVLGITPRPRLARTVLGCTAAQVAGMVASHVVVARPRDAVSPTAPPPRAVALRGAA
jgi:nucleotide-binding universal stress UspA family protein